MIPLPSPGSNCLVTALYLDGSGAVVGYRKYVHGEWSALRGEETPREAAWRWGGRAGDNAEVRRLAEGVRVPVAAFGAAGERMVSLADWLPG